jgi:hypothetical protein
MRSQREYIMLLSMIPAVYLHQRAVLFTNVPVRTGTAD